MREGHYCWLARARSSYWGDSYSHYNLAEPSGEPQGPMEAQLALLGIYQLVGALDAGGCHGSLMESRREAVGHGMTHQSQP